MTSRSLAHPFAARRRLAWPHLRRRSGGESSSTRALRMLSKRWIEIDCVPFEHVDVDHVLLSESGVFAVETRFTSVEWSEGSTGFQNALVEARARAKKIKCLLANSGKPTVTPMLVVWGPGAPKLDGEYELIDEVLVCRGASPKSWIGHLEALPRTVDRDDVTRMADAVRERVRAGARSAAPSV